MFGSLSMTILTKAVQGGAFRVRFFTGCFTLAMGLAGAIPAPAQDFPPLNRELAKDAEQIKLLLNRRGEKAIAVGDFRAPAKLTASAGTSISKALADELSKLQVEDRKRAELEVNGEYRDVEDTQTHSRAVQINGQVVDRNGILVLTLVPRLIFDPKTIAVLTGANVVMPPHDPSETPATCQKKRDEALKTATDNPQPQIRDESRASAGVGSPYAIEILAASAAGYEPRQINVDRDGFAFVKIHGGEQYAVRLINNSPDDAAVTLAIDGLSVFTFSQNREYTHWIVPARTALLVEGWHLTNQVTSRFEVTRLADCAAAKLLRSSGNVGTVTAAFALAWPASAPVPPGEAQGKGVDDWRDEPTGTGIGSTLNVNYQEVRRHVGRLRAAISIRYNKAPAIGSPSVAER